MAKTPERQAALTRLFPKKKRPLKAVFSFLELLTRFARHRYSPDGLRAREFCDAKRTSVGDEANGSLCSVGAKLKLKALFYESAFNLKNLVRVAGLEPVRLLTTRT